MMSNFVRDYNLFYPVIVFSLTPCGKKLGKAAAWGVWFKSGCTGILTYVQVKRKIEIQGTFENLLVLHKRGSRGKIGNPPYRPYTHHNPS